MTYLLDVNLLVALTWPNHLFHRQAQEWFRNLGDDDWATNSLTEMGLVRISMNPQVTGTAVGWRGALGMIEAIRATPGHQLWAEEFDVLNSPLLLRAPVGGYRQVTDVYLAALALERSGKLATLDAGVRDALHPDDRDVVGVINL